RLKCAEPDVKCDLGRFDPTLANAVEDLWREVQARSRRGDRTEWLGVNGLILLAIGRRIRAVDVRRQRDVPNPFQHAEEIANWIEAQMALAERAPPDDLGREFVRILAGLSAEINPFADAELASGVNQCLPFQGLCRKLLGQQHLDAPV